MKIIEDAKTIVQGMLLQVGELPPFMLIDGTVSCKLVPLDNLPETAHERVTAVFNIGSEMALQGNVGQLKTVVFVSRGWLAESKGEHPLDVRPSRDPHRKEMVLIVALNVVVNKQESATFQITRDMQGAFSLLEPYTKEREPYSPFLPAFVKGYNFAL